MRGFFVRVQLQHWVDCLLRALATVLTWPPLACTGVAGSMFMEKAPPWRWAQQEARM